MPNAKGHLIGGLAFYAASGLIPLTAKHLPFSSPKEIFVGIPICLFGALFPDIDTHSEGRKLLNAMVLVGIACAIVYKHYTVAALLFPIAMLAKLASHRGVTHNPLFVCVVPAMIFYTIKTYAPWMPEINPHYYGAFIVGAISHIVLDVIQTSLKRKGFLKGAAASSAQKVPRRS